MSQSLFQLFERYPDAAILISILISIAIAIAGIIPSVFITAANILFFGFVNGTIISFAGESIGALIAFILYRAGFRKKAVIGSGKYPALQKLLHADNRSAFYLVISLRLLPFVPSGLVTFAASLGKITLLSFFIASSAGKVPSLLIEAWSVYQVTRFGWEGKLILAIIALLLVLFVVKKIFRNNQSTTS